MCLSVGIKFLPCTIPYLSYSYRAQPWKEFIIYYRINFNFCKIIIWNIRLVTWILTLKDLLLTLYLIFTYQQKRLAHQISCTVNKIYSVFYGQCFGRNFEITVNVSAHTLLSVPLSVSLKQLTAMHQLQFINITRRFY